jgi:hypothetical protein
MGFTAGDTNLYRYVGNSATDETDPSGLTVPGQGGPAVSVAAQIQSGAVGANAGSAAPISIVMSEKGASPIITTNIRKSNQANQVGPNTNPWLSRGGPNAIVGDVVNNCISLEWVLTFDNTPSPGQWGRTIYSNTWSSTGFTVKNGIVTVYTSKGANDTDLWNDYIVGKSVYMYDQPGRRFFGSPTFVFDVWAKSTNGKTTISQWYYVNPSAGQFYLIANPTVVP